MLPDKKFVRAHSRSPLGPPRLQFDMNREQAHPPRAGEGENRSGAPRAAFLWMNYLAERRIRVRCSRARGSLRALARSSRGWRAMLILWFFLIPMWMALGL